MASFRLSVWGSNLRAVRTRTLLHTPYPGQNHLATLGVRIPQSRSQDSGPASFSCLRSLHQQALPGDWYRNLMSKRILFISGGIAAIVTGLQIYSRAYCRSQPAAQDSEPDPSSPLLLPAITLYQYQTCPFCCKTRAFLDYYGIGYETVEVNPLFRREIKFSKYRKVPFIVVDGVQVNDSSLVISVLRTCMVSGRDISEGLALYPEMSYTDVKGKTQLERANKYFVMFGEAGETGGMSIGESREERQWREWVDTRMVHALSPNIYRTVSESLQAFEYISSVGNFNALERFLAKYVGAAAMYLLAKTLKKKYNLKPDVRQSLYDYCNKWTRAIGKHRRFMGGNQPNLADLAVYGVLSAIEGLDAFKDMQEHTQIGPWYQAVKEEVTHHHSTGRTL